MQANKYPNLVSNAYKNVFFDTYAGRQGPKNIEDARRFVFNALIQMHSSPLYYASHSLDVNKITEEEKKAILNFSEDIKKRAYRTERVTEFITTIINQTTQNILNTVENCDEGFNRYTRRGDVFLRDYQLLMKDVTEICLDSGISIYHMFRIAKKLDENRKTSLFIDQKHSSEDKAITAESWNLILWEMQKERLFNDKQQHMSNWKL